jgi:hypothetical protein
MPVVIQQNVVQFEVSVNYSTFVQEVQCQADFGRVKSDESIIINSYKEEKQSTELRTFLF